METVKQTCTIPKQLTTLNVYINAERCNRFLGAKIKKDETMYCTHYVRVLQPILQPVKATFTWITDDEKTDSDNLTFGAKFIFDALVKTGILENDGRKQVLEIHHLFATEKGNARCIVELSTD